MELIVPTTAKVLAWYDHPAWGKYAAVTRNTYGKGVATYIGFGTNAALTDKILAEAVKNAGLWGKDQDIRFPLIVKSGINQQNKAVHYYFNYSGQAQILVYPYASGKSLLSS